MSDDDPTWGARKPISSSGLFAGMDMMQREYEDRLARCKMEKTLLSERLERLEAVAEAARARLPDHHVTCNATTYGEKYCDCGEVDLREAIRALDAPDGGG